MAKILRTVYDLRPDIEENNSRKRSNFPEIAEDEFWEFYDIAKPYSMLGIPGFYNLYQSVDYIAANDLGGDFAECGCLFGGACIFMALLRERRGLGDRMIHVFDTFAGFPEGSTDTRLGEVSRGPRYSSFYDAVVDNFARTCGTDGVEFSVGPVEETLATHDPPPLSLLRLDTDFYSSTKIELEVLYPALVAGGVLIIDDYGWYEGSRRATDEYLAACEQRPMLTRVDSAVWTGTKPGGVAPRDRATPSLGAIQPAGAGHGRPSRRRWLASRRRRA